jgi:hypothetical protein
MGWRTVAVPGVKNRSQSVNPERGVPEVTRSVPQTGFSALVELNLLCGDRFLEFSQEMPTGIDH